MTLTGEVETPRINSQFLGIRGYPTMVFFSEDGDPIMPVVGYYTPQQLSLILR